VTFSWNIDRTLRHTTKLSHPPCIVRCN